MSLNSHSPGSFCDQCWSCKIKKHHFFSVRGEQKIEASKRISPHWLCCQDQDSQEHRERLLLLGRFHIRTRLLAKLGFFNGSKRRLSSSWFLGFEMQPRACKSGQGLRHANIQQGTGIKVDDLTQDQSPELSNALIFFFQVIFRLAT